MSSYIIKNATIVNENNTFKSDVLIENEIIKEIATDIIASESATIIDAKGKYLIPGFIDDQVHFREPGLTHKANIATESKAAVAGGITTFIEQPNTVPQATTQELLENKFKNYDEKGTFIKWNPAVKTEQDRLGLWEALLDDRIDVLATDHAPHTIEEKNNVYTKAPSGGPLVQHAVTAILEKVKEGVIPIEKAVEKMSHNPAKLFQIEKRGFVKEGYYADLVLIDTNKSQTVTKENILYKCGWSPFEGTTFSSTITHTFVNGNLMYNEGVFNEEIKGKRLTFDR
ncbi:UNVERIFIED_CONTAM: hypothetical protein GTU68_047243 [Idotea baltica]|nr:hypothetical protein [Idotea baltica]